MRLARYKAVRLLDGPAAEREEPGLRVGSVLAALHTPLSGHCEPEQLAAALAADAVDAGADVREEVCSSTYRTYFGLCMWIYLCASASRIVVPHTLGFISCRRRCGREHAVFTH